MALNRFTAMLLLLFASLLATAQEDKQPAFSAQDSVCLKKMDEMIKVFKVLGNQRVWYFRNDEFFIILAQVKPGDTRLRALNLGGDKKITIALHEMKVASFDSAGTRTEILVNEPSQLIAAQPFTHCNSFSINLGDIKMKNAVRSEYLWVKIKLTYDDKEVIADLKPPTAEGSK
jgi:hypothetical protein